MCEDGGGYEGVSVVARVSVGCGGDVDRPFIPTALNFPFELLFKNLTATNCLCVFTTIILQSWLRMSVTDTCHIANIGVHFTTQK